MPDQTNWLPLFNALFGSTISLIALIIAVNARKKSEGMQQIEARIKSFLDQFELRMRRGEIQVNIDPEAARRLHLENMEEMRGCFVEKSSYDTRCKYVDHELADKDHRITRNSQQANMLFGMVFDIMRHLGLRRPDQPHD